MNTFLKLTLLFLLAIPIFVVAIVLMILSVIWSMILGESLSRQSMHVFNRGLRDLEKRTEFLKTTPTEL